LIFVFKAASIELTKGGRHLILIKRESLNFGEGHHDKNGHESVRGSWEERKLGGSWWKLGTGQAIFQIIMQLESKFASFLPLQQRFCLEKNNT